MNGQKVDAIQLLKTLMGLEESLANRKMQVHVIEGQISTLWDDIRMSLRNADLTEIQRLQGEENRLREEVAKNKQKNESKG